MKRPQASALPQQALRRKLLVTKTGKYIPPGRHCMRYWTGTCKGSGLNQLNLSPGYGILCTRCADADLTCGVPGTAVAQPGSTAAQSANAEGGSTPSQEQAAAFQQAYSRILAEQMALLLQVRPPAPPFLPSTRRPTPSVPDRLPTFHLLCAPAQQRQTPSLHEQQQQQAAAVQLPSATAGAAAGASAGAAAGAAAGAPADAAAGAAAGVAAGAGAARPGKTTYLADFVRSKVRRQGGKYQRTGCGSFKGGFKQIFTRV